MTTGEGVAGDATRREEKGMGPGLRRGDDCGEMGMVVMRRGAPVHSKRKPWLPSSAGTAEHVIIIDLMTIIELQCRGTAIN
jgi:hypothetical protein